VQDWSLRRVAAMARIINSPYPWICPSKVRPIDDDDIFIYWQGLSEEQYEKMLKRWDKENGLDNSDSWGLIGEKENSNE
jgi:hypothetical protein